MSRSYKKNPLWKCERSKKFGKKVANNKVREYRKFNKTIKNGGSYKKIYDSWDICDCKSSMTFEEYKRRCSKFYKSEKEIYIDWYRSYKRK